MATVNLGGFEHQRPHTLSGGEKRRLAIAGVLAMKPTVVVFDEPFSDLDYPGVKQVLQQILALHRAGHTILVTTHDLEKVIVHANRLVIMQNGKVVRNGPPEDLIKETEVFGVREPCASRLGMEIQSWLS
jgi:biotin transport system ATP-binding protein